MGDFFKQKKRTPEVSVVADPYKGIRESTSGWLTGKMGKPQTYGKEMVGGMSPQEQKSLGYLEEYGAGKPSKLRGAATAEIQKTLEGGYDPTSSPYYQAVKAEAARNLEGTQADISDMAAGGGRYWAGARLGEQREAGTDVTIGLNKFLGELAERERVRKLQVLPMAGQFAGEEERVPLEKAAAFQSLGALPRTVEDARKKAIYQEWVRGTQDYPLEVAKTGAGVQQAPVYGEVGYEPSGYEKWIQPWIDPLIQTSMAVGTGGASLPYQAAYNAFKGMGKKKTK